MTQIISTQSNSINRALDQIGDKWCQLILQEVFWGIKTFNEMLTATGSSRGVLSSRLQWLQEIECLRKETPEDNPKRPTYHLTTKSLELYQSALMAVVWERKYYNTPELDDIELVHDKCGHAIWPEIKCGECEHDIKFNEVFYRDGPGAGLDKRTIKTRRRTLKLASENNASRMLYKNFIDLVGDRWTANIIALAFHRFKRFDQFHSALPIATNILSERLKSLVNAGIFYQHPYQHSPVRYEYLLTDKGKDLYPYFLALLQWGDKWCGDEKGAPVLLMHGPCGQDLKAVVQCNVCKQPLIATEVHYKR